MREQGETLGTSGEEMDVGNIDPAEMIRAAEDLARAHPHAAVAGAFAVGFLLGGGLTPRLLTSLVVFAGRRYAAEAARQALELAMHKGGFGEEGEAAATAGLGGQP